MKALFPKPFSFLAKISIICLCLFSFTIYLPATAFPYGSGVHGRVAHHAFDLFDTPELRVYQSTIEQWAVDADYWTYDEITKEWKWFTVAVRDHFWNPDDNTGLSFLGFNLSAAEKAQNYWDIAIQNYRAALQAEKQGQDGSSFRHEAYKFLGNVAHLLTDMACPAHAHNDAHGQVDITNQNIIVDADYYENYTESHINPNWFNKPGLKPIQVSPVKNSIWNIMYNLAQRTQHFPSKGSETLDGDHPGNNTVDNAYGVFDYSLDSWPSGWPNYTPDQLTDSNDPDGARKEQMANILVPLAQSYVAGLYKTFWELFNISITVLDEDNYSVNWVHNLTKTKITGSGTINSLNPTYWEWDLDYDGSNFNPKPENCGSDKATTEPIIRTNKSQVTIAVRASNGNEVSRISTKILNVGGYPINMSYPEGYDSYKRCFNPPVADPPGLITRWEWDFGDGNLAEGRQQCHEYAVANFYTITLKVTDDQGDTYTSHDYTFAGPGTRYIQGHKITGQETWYHGGTYVIMGSITVAQGGTLTVETGAKVYLYSGVSISVSGTMTATGATFSWADGYHRWGGISFVGASNDSRLEGCTIQHAGWNNNPVIGINYCSPTITGCTITGDGDRNLIGIKISGDGTKFAAPIINNNIISDMSRGINGNYALGSTIIIGNQLNNNNIGISTSYTYNSVIMSNIFNANSIDMEIGGSITNKIVWNEATSYLVGGLTINEGGSLTIPSGRKVLFHAGNDIYVGGTLKATGVDFTWADGQNKWGGITFSGASNDSRLENCTIQHAGWNNHPAISIYYCSPTITGCTITGEANPAYTGIYIYGDYPQERPTAPVITNNNISGMSTAIHGVYEPYPVITGNSIKGNDCGINCRIGNDTIIRNNTYDNKLDIACYGTITAQNWDSRARTYQFNGCNIAQGTSLIWDNAAGEYELNSYISISQGASLTITSGPKVTCGAGASLSVSGTLKATGVNFTWADGQNKWGGITFNMASNDSRLEGCTVQNAGRNNIPAISIYYCSPTINGCTITGEASTAYVGVYLYGDYPQPRTAPVITNNTISSMSAAIQGNYSSYPVITGNNIKNNTLGINLNNLDNTTSVTENTFSGNVSYALSYTGSGSLNAPNNNWGHASGPLDNSDDRVAGGLFNPNGLGNRVSDKVNYYPWAGCTIGTTATSSGFKATPDNGAINLSWSANGEASLGGYKLYYGTSSGNYTTPVLLGKVTSHKLTGLNNGQTYYVTLSSMNTVGFESARTAELVVKPHESNTITASAGSHGSISPSGSVTVPVGTNKTFTISPDSGYHIADVRVDGDSVGAVSSYRFSKVIEDHTIVASFAIDTHTINSAAGPGGSISPVGTVDVNHGSNQSFSIKPDTNYNIKSVLVDGVSVGPVSSYTFKNVTENHSIAASFVAATISILTDKDQVIVPPGKTAPLLVKLSDPPQTNVTVTVAWKSGSKALSIHGAATLTFTPANWNTYQTVQIAATPDRNDMNASAVFELSAPGVTGKQITAVKAEIGNIAPILELLLD